MEMKSDCWQMSQSRIKKKKRGTQSHTLELYEHDGFAEKKQVAEK